MAASPAQQGAGAVAAAAVACCALYRCCSALPAAAAAEADSASAEPVASPRSRVPAKLLTDQPLPQPAVALRSRIYAYVTCDGIGELHQGFPYAPAGVVNDGSPTKKSEGACSPLEPGTLVWVSQSKKKGGANSAGEMLARAAVVADPFAAAEGSAKRAGSAGGGGKRRVSVRYPQGSTYSARRRMLAPILPRSPGQGPGYIQDVVIVAPDTACYRRLCRIHTLPGDTFLEIGCDFGACTVGAAESLVASVPGEAIPVRHQSTAFGVDKSTDSVTHANRLHCTPEANITRGASVVFEEADALSAEGAAAIRKRCAEVLGAAPSVVAIDINGNRPLDAVLDCLTRTLQPQLPNGEQIQVAGSDEWALPRLIVVKSEELHRAVADARM